LARSGAQGRIQQQTKKKQERKKRREKAFFEFIGEGMREEESSESAI